MAIVIRVPPGMREMLRSIDPAAGIESTPQRSAAAIIAAAGDQLPEEHRAARSTRPRVVAPVAAVIFIIIAAAGVLIVRDRSGSAPQRAANSPSASTPSTPTYALAAPPPAFPADASPRPVVVLDPAVQVSASGFPDDDSKIAFGNGDIDLATSLPPTPANRDGYPLQSAASAVNDIKNVHACCITTRTRLRINSIALVEHRYLTDRGDRPLPAWQLRFTGLSTTVTVLAVAGSARYPSNAGSDPSAGALTVSSDGRTLTLRFVAHHVASIPCDTSYHSYLAVSQNASAVRISVRIVQDEDTSSSSEGMCSAVRFVPRGPLTPGAPNTKTVELKAPLGSRLVVDLRNHPYVVTQR